LGKRTLRTAYYVESSASDEGILIYPRIIAILPDGIATAIDLHFGLNACHATGEEWENQQPYSEPCTQPL
jgi:hypothetical protein